MKKLIFCILPFFCFGSFAQKPVPDETEMCQLLTKMMTGDKLYREGEILLSQGSGKNKYSKSETDSVWALQQVIDNSNTEKLIELTKNYGWISDERIKCSDLHIWIIFRHSQKEYFAEISELIEKEHNAKRLSNFQYKIIKNHLNGRPAP